MAMSSQAVAEPMEDGEVQDDLGESAMAVATIGAGGDDAAWTTVTRSRQVDTGDARFRVYVSKVRQASVQLTVVIEDRERFEQRFPGVSHAHGLLLQSTFLQQAPPEVRQVNDEGRNLVRDIGLYIGEGDTFIVSQVVVQADQQMGTQWHVRAVQGVVMTNRKVSAGVWKAVHNRVREYPVLIVQPSHKLLKNRLADATIGANWQAAPFRVPELDDGKLKGGTDGRGLLRRGVVQARIFNSLRPGCVVLGFVTKWSDDCCEDRCIPLDSLQRLNVASIRIAERYYHTYVQPMRWHDASGCLDRLADADMLYAGVQRSMEDDDHLRRVATNVSLIIVGVGARVQTTLSVRSDGSPGGHVATYKLGETLLARNGAVDWNGLQQLLDAQTPEVELQPGEVAPARYKLPHVLTVRVDDMRYVDDSLWLGVTPLGESAQVVQWLARPDTYTAEAQHTWAVEPKRHYESSVLVKRMAQMASDLEQVGGLTRAAMEEFVGITPSPPTFDLTRVNVLVPYADMGWRPDEEQRVVVNLMRMWECPRFVSIIGPTGTAKTSTLIDCGITRANCFRAHRQPFVGRFVAPTNEACKAIMGGLERVSALNPHIRVLLVQSKSREQVDSAPRVCDIRRVALNGPAPTITPTKPEQLALNFIARRARKTEELAALDMDTEDGIVASLTLTRELRDLEEEMQCVVVEWYKPHVIVTTVANFYDERLRSLKPADMILVDEAGKVTSATAAVLCMTMEPLHTSTMVFGGDHIGQLGCYTRMYGDASKYAEWSVLARLVGGLSITGQPQPVGSAWRLSQNKRMPPMLTSLVSDACYRPFLLEMSTPPSYVAGDAPGFRWTQTANQLAFVQVDGADCRDANGQVVNHDQAAVCVRLLQHIVGGGRYGEDDFVVLVAYQAQRQLLLRMAQEAGVAVLAKQVMTIDSFQGRQARLVVVSFERSSAALRVHGRTGAFVQLEAHLGFMLEPKRQTVALTRSRGGLIVVADPYSMDHLLLFRGYVRLAQHIGAFYTSLDELLEHSPSEIQVLPAAPPMPLATQAAAPAPAATAAPVMQTPAGDPMDTSSEDDDDENAVLVLGAPRSCNAVHNRPGAPAVAVTPVERDGAALVGGGHPPRSADTSANAAHMGASAPLSAAAPAAKLTGRERQAVAAEATAREMPISMAEQHCINASNARAREDGKARAGAPTARAAAAGAPRVPVAAMMSAAAFDVYFDGRRATKASKTSAKPSASPKPNTSTRTRAPRK